MRPSTLRLMKVLRDSASRRATQPKETKKFAPLWAAISVVKEESPSLTLPPMRHGACSESVRERSTIGVTEWSTAESEKWAEKLQRRTLASRLSNPEGGAVALGGSYEFRRMKSECRIDEKRKETGCADPALPGRMVWQTTERALTSIFSPRNRRGSLALGSCDVEGQRKTQRLYTW